MFNITVHDVEEIKKFYEKVLEFKIVTEQKYDNGWHFVKMEMPGGTAINLIKDEKAKPGLMKIYLETSDIKKAYTDLKGKGAKPNNEVKSDHWDRPVKWFDFSDPEGNQWVILQF